jgi:hypothetical protein
MLKEGKRPFDPQHHLHLPANEPSNSHGPMMYLLPKTSANILRATPNSATIYKQRYSQVWITNNRLVNELLFF